MRPHLLGWLSGHVGGDVANFLAPSWFTCVGFAGLVTLILVLVLGRRRGIDPGTLASAVLWSYVAAVVAGFGIPMALDGLDQLVTTGHVHVRWAGMTSWWGYLAGIAAVALVCKRDGLPLGRMGDLAVIPLGVALAFARMGCFMAGCDYGKVSSLPWAVRFPAGSPAWRDHVHAGLVAADRPESLPVHPTQLYEALLGLAIVGIAIYARRRTRKDGELFLIAAAAYAIGRLVIEALRGDAGRGIYAGLSSGQILSLVVLLAIGARFALARRRAVMTMAMASAFVLAIAHVGEAHAQPGETEPLPEPPPIPGDTEPLPEPPPVPPGELPFEIPDVPPPAPQPDLAERPQFFTGVLFGVATPVNRRPSQIPTLTGASLSLGYLPGRFGVWIDLDSYANNDATHDTLLVSGSFTQKLTRHLTIGARLGLGETEVKFKDPAFRNVTGTTVRVEAIAEYVLARHWSIWVRPLTLDTLSASELGGPITTYQVRLGFTYRFGSRHNAVHPAPAAPTIGAL